MVVMNNETIVEVIPKDIFDFPGLKPLVYEVITEKSTPMHPLGLKDVSCTLSWKIPNGISLKNRNPDDYMYLIIRLKDEDG